MHTACIAIYLRAGALDLILVHVMGDRVVLLLTTVLRNGVQLVPNVPLGVGTRNPRRVPEVNDESRCLSPSCCSLSYCWWLA